MSNSGSALGSRFAGAGAYGGGRVGLGQAVAHRELVEAAHRHDGPAGAAGGERRVLGVALPQVDEELRDQPLLDPAEVHHATGGEEGEVAAQVAPVGLERVVGEPALDHQVVEVGAQRLLDLRRASGCLRGLGRRGGVQASTSSSDAAPISWAWPTGALVRCPAWVLSPSARAWSSRQACCQPLSASATV